MRAARSGAVHMAVAFVAMGAWAAWANSAHPMPRPLIAGLVQGCMSALITLFLKRMLETLARNLPGPAALIVPPVLAVLVSFGLLASLHHLADTPEIGRTIMVPLSVTALYATLYTFALWRHRHG